MSLRSFTAALSLFLYISMYVPRARLHIALASFFSVRVCVCSRLFFFISFFFSSVHSHVLSLLFSPFFARDW